MKKRNSSQRSLKGVVKATGAKRSITIGMDQGDRSSCYCVLDQEGEVVREESVGTTKKAMAQVFGSLSRCRIAIEVGTHSPWVSAVARIGA